MERLVERSAHPVSQLLSSLASPHYQRVCCKKENFVVFYLEERLLGHFHDSFATVSWIYIGCKGQHYFGFRAINTDIISCVYDCCPMYD